MTLVTWIKENGNGAVCVGTIPDGAYDEATCIIVPDRPSQAHFWNNTSKAWEITLDSKKRIVRGQRNSELARTDKYVLTDYLALFSAEEQASILAYRQALRDVPNHESIEEIVMPECPDIIK